MAVRQLWNLAVRVRGGLYATRNGNRIAAFDSGDVLPKGRELLFEAVTATGFPFPANGYDVRWRVVNTDREAVQAKGLRGGFYKSHRPGVRGRARHTTAHTG